MQNILNKIQILNLRSRVKVTNQALGKNFCHAFSDYFGPIFILLCTNIKCDNIWVKSGFYHLGPRSRSQMLFRKNFDMDVALFCELILI